MPMDRMREMLLRETNYRCGYCMRNITPRVYFLNDNPNPMHDYEIYNYNKGKFYNISERCHIIPRAEEDDDFKDFYNLIALCKICHHEVDKSGILGSGDKRKTELAKLKLHWMIASGRFTRLEIDVLMEMYVAYNDDTEDGRIYNYIFLRILNVDGTLYAHHNKKEPLLVKYVVSIGRNMLFIFHNIIKCNFVALDPAITANSNTTFVKPGERIIMPHHELCISHIGFSFCTNFHEVYKELDKIDI